MDLTGAVASIIYEIQNTVMFLDEIARNHLILTEHFRSHQAEFHSRISLSGMLQIAQEQTMNTKTRNTECGGVRYYIKHGIDVLGLGP